MAAAGLLFLPTCGSNTVPLHHNSADRGLCPKFIRSTLEQNVAFRRNVRLEEDRAARISSRTSSFARTKAVANLDSPATLPAKLRPSAAEVARTLMEVCWEGTLATVSEDGWPFGTHVRFSVDAGGRPVLRLQPGALQSRHIAGDGRCSLHVKLELPGKQKPQCTLKGRVCSPGDDVALLQLETAWQKRYGTDTEDEDSSVCWIEVETVLTTADVGEEEVWVAAQDYSRAEADPLRDCAPKIVGDMNRDSWEDIRRFCSSYAGMEEEVEEARMTWVDRFGFDLRVLTREPLEVREVRIPFLREVNDDRDARAAITLMAQLSWERERQYVPPAMGALTGSPTAF